MTEQLSFIETIKKYIESGELVLPVFSTTAMRVQQELTKKEPDMRIVEQIISGDQSLASQVLKIANSSFYKGLSEILTIKAAIVRLGMQEISRITLIAATSNQFVTKDRLLNTTMKLLWQHSVGTALGAHWLAKRCKLEDIAGHAFFAGLLHDVGKLFVLLVLDKMKRGNRNIKFTEALVFEAMESLHTEQGYQLMQEWNMPAQYCQVVRDHHEDEFDTKNTVLLLVRMTNIVCHKLGIGTDPEPNSVPSTTMEASMLNVTELDLAELEIVLEDTPALAK